MQCISIPECTQRLSHLTTLGGQHGQESKEGKERSEEDCEEDPPGQEEEVNLASRNCRRLDAGTSREPRGRFAFRSRLNRTALVDERGCRRDIRSNGWIDVSNSSKTVRQKKSVFFVRCGSLSSA